MGFASLDGAVREADSGGRLDQGHMGLATSKQAAEECTEQTMEAAFVYALWKG